MTVFGGLKGDTLVAGGGSVLGAGGSSSVTAGLGNETLIGSATGHDTLVGNASSKDQFGFQYEKPGASYLVDNFHVGDTLYFANAAAANQAISGYTTSGGNGLVTLHDGRRYRSIGYTGTLTHTNVTHG